MSKKIQYKFLVKSNSDKIKKLKELKEISDIKNITSQKDKKGNIYILFQTKIIQSKEVLDFISINKDKYNLQEIKV